MRRNDSVNKDRKASSIKDHSCGIPVYHMVSNTGRSVRVPVADRVLVTDQVRVWRADAAVRLPSTGDRPARSVLSFFRDTVEKHGDRVALAEEHDGEWKQLTYRQYFDASVKAAKGFIKLGLEPSHTVCILGFNSPEWMISQWGAVMAGGLAAGIYQTNSAEMCQFILENGQCNIAVVENEMQLQKILKFWETLPHLKAIVQYKGEPEQLAGVYSWTELMKYGESAPNSTLQSRLNGLAVNKCALLIYTSGTTGEPKGVMISHDNVNTAVDMLYKFMLEVTEGAVGFTEQSRVVSYLPLSHVAALCADVFLACRIGSTVYYGRPDALRGSLGETLKKVQPTIFFGVPRVYEKFREAIQPVQEKMNLPNEKVRALLGLGSLEKNLALVGAAPTQTETMEYFHKIGIDLMEIYGMSESTGPHTVGRPKKFRFGSVGYEFAGVETIMLDVHEESGKEVCYKGRHVFMGYLNMKDRTLETIDENGVLHSGDLGRVDDEGFLHITGRIKELVITAGGENVPPVPIENHVKAAQPTLISNCMVVGDRRKFLSLLVSLRVKVDPRTTAPLDELAPDLVKFLESKGSKSTTVNEVIESEDPVVYDAIQAAIADANRYALSRAQHVQKFELLQRDFSVPGGELGPTLKLKRPVVLKKYEKLIDSLYS